MLKLWINFLQKELTVKKRRESVNPLDSPKSIKNARKDNWRKEQPYRLSNIHIFTFAME